MMEVKTVGQIAIAPKGPFAWYGATDVLGHFAPMQRHWGGDADAVRLAFPLDQRFTPVAVAPRFADGMLRREVAGTDDLAAVTAQVARIFSLDHHGSAYPLVGERDPKIGALMAALPGLRPVCFTSPDETAAWAIISQRISMRQAARIQDDPLAAHGHPIRVAGQEACCFPEPERLLRITSIPGLSSEKIDRLRGSARAALDGQLDAERLRTLGDEAGPASLRTIRGIGDFWSQRIYLRGCGIVDVFPDEPLAVAALGHLHGLGDRPNAVDFRRSTDIYRPFRRWVCFLRHVATGRRLIPDVTGREGAIRRQAIQRKKWETPPAASAVTGSSARRRLGE
jgi:DNA-3-methyladenine glycosylase II